MGKLWNKPSLSLSTEQITNLQSETEICSDVTDVCDNEQKESETVPTAKKQSLEAKSIELLPKVGDVVIFSSFTFHKSNSNQSKRMRRVMMTQYSTFPIID